jgi:CheY-like chemotaxis protein
MKNARILVVDDDPTNIALMEAMLADAGFTQVLSTTDSRRVLSLYCEFQPDIILLDLLMPHVDGLAVLETIAEAFGGEDFPPVLVLTADATPATKKIALAAGASDFLTKPFNQTEALLRIAFLLDSHFAVTGRDRGLPGAGATAPVQP